MIAACDIGNTNIKAGLFDGDTLTGFHTFASVNDFISFIKNQDVTTLAVSSVVPVRLNEIKKLINNHFPIYEINKSSSFNLKIDYDTIDTLGIDRICSCEGAFYLYKNSGQFKKYSNTTYLLTIDFGTATTINFIKYPGVFTGGMIAPGIITMANSLHSGTAQLPEIEISDFTSFIGKSTKGSIASGIMNSTIGLIERVSNYLRDELEAEDIKFFITGGNMELIFPFFPYDCIDEKALVLYGINAVYKKNFI